jgi:preprotein translocase subunit SecA
MNTQREVIYAQRQKVLDGEDLRQSVMNMLRTVVDSTVSDALSEFGGIVDEQSLSAVLQKFEGLFFAKGAYAMDEKMPTAEELSDEIFRLAEEHYHQKELAVAGLNLLRGDEKIDMRELERVVMLRVVDEYWMDNIDAMDDLKQGIGLRAYGQHDPVIAYKEEGYQMFEAMINSIREDTVRRLFAMQVRPAQQVQRQRVAKEVSASGSSDGTVKKQPVKTTKKAGPNDPCPCGSGKKYKKCCMQKDKSETM